MPTRACVDGEGRVEIDRKGGLVGERVPTSERCVAIHTRDGGTRGQSEGLCFCGLNTWVGLHGAGRKAEGGIGGIRSIDGECGRRDTVDTEKVW